MDIQLQPPVTGADHLRGAPSATVTLVEYGDFECPHCAHAHTLLHQLLQRKAGKLRFVFRHFPLREVHEQALSAARAAEAASQQGQFWAMHDLLYENQSSIEEKAILQWASQLELDVDQFRQDWQSMKGLAKVETDFESGVRSGVNGTPGFFLNGKLLLTYDGTYDSLSHAVESNWPGSR